MRIRHTTLEARTACHDRPGRQLAGSRLQRRGAGAHRSANLMEYYAQRHGTGGHTLGRVHRVCENHHQSQGCRLTTAATGRCGARNRLVPKFSRRPAKPRREPRVGFPKQYCRRRWWAQLGARCTHSSLWPWSTAQSCIPPIRFPTLPSPTLPQPSVTTILRAHKASRPLNNSVSPLRESGPAATCQGRQRTHEPP